MSDNRRHLSETGARKSRRALNPETARQMVLVREARRAFTKYRVRCFWSYDPALKITAADVPWVAEQLMRNGDRDAFRLGAKLAARCL